MTGSTEKAGQLCYSVCFRLGRVVLRCSTWLCTRRFQPTFPVPMDFKRGRYSPECFAW